MPQEKNRSTAPSRSGSAILKWLSATVIIALLAALAAVLSKSVAIEGVPSDIFVPLGAEQLSASRAGAE
jgi:hypothetical protein